MVKTPARRNAPHIAVIDGKPTTTSRDIAETFGKRHDNLLRAIAALECSADFRALNFEETLHEVQGPNGAVRKEAEYRITRDGFAFLCMGFTGAKAAQWKERYINTFNRMAEKLAAPAMPMRRPPGPPALSRVGPQLPPEGQAAVTARTLELVSTAMPAIHKWLTDQVMNGAVRADGSLAANFASTLEHADFAAFTTNYASRRVEFDLMMIDVLHKKTGELKAELVAKRAELEVKGKL